MYAILETGSKQYKVSPGDIIKVENLNLEAGSETVLRPLLLVFDKELHIGNPYLAQAGAICDVLKTDRDPKITVFKHKRRKGYRRKRGHRQFFTLVKVKEIKLVAPDQPTSTKKAVSRPKKAVKSVKKTTKKKPVARKK